MPFNMGWMNHYGGLGQSPTKLADRQPEIPLGEDVMFDHFENAIQWYNWGYDLPNQPPNTKVAWDSNLQGKTQIRWSAFAKARWIPIILAPRRRTCAGIAFIDQMWNIRANGNT